MPSATPVEPITLPAPADYRVEEGGDLVERAKRFRVLPQERECAQSSPDVIVVCAPKNDERYRYRPAGPPPPTAMEEAAAKLKWKAGPAEAEIRAIKGVAESPGVAVSARIRF